MVLYQHSISKLAHHHKFSVNCYWRIATWQQSQYLHPSDLLKQTLQPSCFTSHQLLNVPISLSTNSSRLFYNSTYRYLHCDQLHKQYWYGNISSTGSHPSKVISPGSIIPWQRQERKRTKWEGRQITAGGNFSEPFEPVLLSVLEVYFPILFLKKKIGGGEQYQVF